MDFTLSDEQIMFMDSAGTLLGATCGPDHWRKMMERGEAFDGMRWATLVENGFTQLLLPETQGGLGLGEIDFAVIAEKAGYVALPEPLVESAGVALPMLARLAPGHSLLIDPGAIIAIAHPINPVVAHADISAAILVERDGDTFLLPTDKARLTPVATIDPLRRLSRLEWDKADAEHLDEGGWDEALDRAAVFYAAFALGMAQRCIDMAVAYAKERQQFGKPIGSYQAVKHLLANAQVAVEFARPVVLAAAADVRHADIQSRARVSHAKIVALEAADKAARAAIQVHGAMGYSWEVDVHLFLKRTLALTGSWGTPRFHRERVAHRIFTQPNGPDQTFAREMSHA